MPLERRSGQLMEAGLAVLRRNACPLLSPWLNSAEYLALTQGVVGSNPTGDTDAQRPFGVATEGTGRCAPLRFSPRMGRWHTKRPVGTVRTRGGVLPSAKR